MNVSKIRAAAAALFVSLSLVACGGSGTSAPDTAAQPNTGNVSLWFTDLPTEDFSSIVLTVSSGVLIASDDSHVPLFDGARDIDLLNLTNYSEPVVFGEVAVGNYKKLRLMIDAIELVPVGGGDSLFVEKLPANGKVDLLQPEGFDVLPGRTLTIEVDVDANKSIKLTGAGKSGKVNFRPVVRVNIYDGGMPHKLARLEGAVSGEPGDGSFVLCDIDAPEHCVDVSTGTMTSFFDEAGTGTDFGGLSDGAMVVVIGEYSSNPIALNAFVVEIGGNEEQVTGHVISEPAGSNFLVLTIGGEDMLVELQEGTKYYDESGMIDAMAIVVGKKVEVEGVIPPADPGMIRAAIVFLEPPEFDQLSGTIAGPVEVPTEAGLPSTFLLSPDGINVCVYETAAILLVETQNSVVTTGEIGDLADGQVVDVFGSMAADDSCFEANEVIVDVDATP